MDLAKVQKMSPQKNKKVLKDDQIMKKKKKDKAARKLLKTPAWLLQRSRFQKEWEEVSINSLEM